MPKRRIEQTTDDSPITNEPKKIELSKSTETVVEPYYKSMFTRLWSAISGLWQPGSENPSSNAAQASDEKSDSPMAVEPDQDQVVETPEETSPMVLTGIENLTTYFYINSQFIIESFYLQPLTQDNYRRPLPKKDKQNLKDGFIEREQHGGMHVARAQFYALIIHQLFKKLFSNYSDTSIKVISEMLNLSEHEIITLTRYAILFHDSARKNEATDHWDHESGNHCAKYFHDKGLPIEIAELFVMAAIYKNRAAQYSKFLLEKNIPADKIEAFHYIRKLIYLSDCLDIIRCVGEFKVIEVAKALGDIPGYNPQAHDPEIQNLIKNIFELINGQKDMLFDCNLILPSGEKLETRSQTCLYSLKEKVGYEHAENVCSVIGENISENPYFAAFLVDEKYESTVKANVTPAYIPHIHGTNAKCFSIFEKTGMTMMGPLQMVESFMMAPMSGELENGISGFTKDCMPCYGKLDSDGTQEYSLDKIIAHYSNMRSWSSSKDDALYIISTAFSRSFGNINSLLIYILRAKQLGFELLDLEKTTEMIANMKATVQYYYLILLIGTYIYPDYTFLETLDADRSRAYRELILDQLTYQNIIAKIRERNLDIKSIYKNPTQEAVEHCLNLFQLNLPQSMIITEDWELHKIEVVFSTQDRKQIFTMTPCREAEKKALYGKHFTPEHFSGYLSRNCSGFGIHDLLGELISRGQSLESLDIMRKGFIYNAQELERKISIFERIASKSVPELQFNARQNFFLTNAFPMIFICENEDKMRLSDFSTKEFRAKEPLQIGSDIRTIATDTEEHRLIVMKYLDENHVHNVKVILFEDLKKSKMTHQEPQSPFVHPQDNFPRLSWLTAKKAAANNINSDDPKLATTIETARTYNNLKFG
jgi:hypothetical protein